MDLKRCTGSRSKGPFYGALADATFQLRRRFEAAGKQATAEEAKRDGLIEETKDLEEERQRLEEQVRNLGRRVQDGDARLNVVSGLLDHADGLTRQGFGEAELVRLHELLAQLSAKQGALPEDGVAQFFETVGRYEAVVSFDLETTRAEARAAAAKADADRWESEARNRESRTKARVGAIDLMETILAQGVRAQDLPHWEAILRTAGVTAEELSGSLEQYGSLEALAKARDEECSRRRESR